MSFSARRPRQGTSASFWRTHNLLQDMMVGACVTPAKRASATPMPVSAKYGATPSWMPTAAQIDRYQARRAAFAAASAH